MDTLVLTARNACHREISKKHQHPGSQADHLEKESTLELLMKHIEPLLKQWSFAKGYVQELKSRWLTIPTYWFIFGPFTITYLLVSASHLF